MSFTQTPVGMPLPDYELQLERYRWVERVETQSGRLAISVDVTQSPPDHSSRSPHVYIRVSPYWPGTSFGLMEELRDPKQIMTHAMVENLSFECLTRYVEMCGWAKIVSVSKDVAVIHGQFSPELFRAHNPWAFVPAEE